MTEKTKSDTKNDSMPRPPHVNGPAFLAFGLLFVVLGIAMRWYQLSVVGLVLTGVGLYGVLALRRYEKAHGIEDVLPGAPPITSQSEDSSDDPGTTSPDS